MGDVDTGSRWWPWRVHYGEVAGLVGGSMSIRPDRPLKSPKTQARRLLDPSLVELSCMSLRSGT